MEIDQILCHVCGNYPNTNRKGCWWKAFICNPWLIYSDKMALLCGDKEEGSNYTLIIPWVNDMDTLVHFFINEEWCLLTTREILTQKLCLFKKMTFHWELFGMCKWWARFLIHDAIYILHEVLTKICKLLIHYGTSMTPPLYIHDSHMTPPNPMRFWLRFISFWSIMVHPWPHHYTFMTP